MKKRKKHIKLLPPWVVGLILLGGVSFTLAGCIMNAQ